jgi:hypothetical protein
MQIFHHLFSSSASSKIVTSIEKDTLHECFTRQYLQEIQNKINFYKNQIERQETIMTPLTMAMKHTIRNFLERNGILPIRMKCDFAVAIRYNEKKYDRLINDFQQREQFSEYEVELYIYIYIYNFVFSVETT